MYRGCIIFEDYLTPAETVTATIEFARFADICGVTGAEHIVARKIGSIIVVNQTNNGHNTDYLTPDHLLSIPFLPEEHPVRAFLADASVAGYLQSKQHKFAQGAKDILSFASNLLLAVNRVILAARHLNIEDLITEEVIYIDYKHSGSTGQRKIALKGVRDKSSTST